MNKLFGERVTELLKKENITQRELAGVVGVTEATMSRYIKGERDPKPETIANIATVLKTTSDYLLGIENDNDDENIGYPRIRRLIARNADKLSDEDKKALISELLSHMGKNGGI